jgi:hypothetical protein
VTVAHTVPHPPGQLPGQEYVSSTVQAGGVHIKRGASVGGRAVGEGVSVSAGVCVTGALHAVSATSRRRIKYRLILISFLDDRDSGCTLRENPVSSTDSRFDIFPSHHATGKTSCYFESIYTGFYLIPINI